VSATSSTTVYVTYQGTPETRFDRGYYVDTHLPLVLKAWQQYGLESIASFFPAVANNGTIAIAELRFQDDSAVGAALSSPEAPDVMGDIPNFTDVQPVLARSVPL
jgi:uncharacterized protein (TIGR02118 family)